MFLGKKSTLLKQSNDFLYKEMIEGLRNSPKLPYSCFFCEFWRGKDDLRVRKEDFDAVQRILCKFFIEPSPDTQHKERQGMG
jgi:hypothetical protein